MTDGFIIAAPASGSGKTILTLGLLRHLRDAAAAVVSFKIGPDYIDPAFHEAASGRPCHNVDLWAMRPTTLGRVLAEISTGAELVIGEGVMGLFDGAPDGRGATADAAVFTGWPVVLVVDVSGQGASAAATVHGFATFRPDVHVAAVIFNNIGSAGHARLLKAACRGLDVPVAGYVPRSGDCAHPDRHLGLVQAAEHAELDAFLDAVAAHVSRHVDVDRLRHLAKPGRADAPTGDGPPLRPLGRRIAVARDPAFAFAYPHVLEGWRRAGADVLPFSPLGDEPVPQAADAVYLPGGYPELHAGRLAGSARFLGSLREAAGRGLPVYGECGGYMVLGDSLVDAEGARHAMAGLLPVETSFAERRMHLGYRAMHTLTESPLGPAGTAFNGHEFHFASVVRESGEPSLFAATDALGADMGACGSVRGSVAGSFLHLIDAA